MQDSFWLMAERVSPAFAVIGLGYFYQRVWGGPVDSLVRLNMNLLMPAFAFIHLHRMKLVGDILGAVFLSAWIILLIPGALAWLAFRGKTQFPRGLYLPIIFMNVVNLPFPLILSVYGPQAVPFALAFYLASILGVFTLGLMIAAGGRGMGRILREPVVYALVLALAANAAHTPIPDLLLKPLSLLESATIPLILLVLGMQLAKAKITQMGWSLTAMGFRFGGGAAAGLACVWMFHLTGHARQVVLLEAVMPCAVISSLIAEKYQADPELVASTVLLSTVFALGWIPLALWWIG